MLLTNRKTTWIFGRREGMKWRKMKDIFGLAFLSCVSLSCCAVLLSCFCLLVSCIEKKIKQLEGCTSGGVIPCLAMKSISYVGEGDLPYPNPNPNLNPSHNPHSSSDPNPQFPNPNSDLSPYSKPNTDASVFVSIHTFTRNIMERITRGEREERERECVCEEREAPEGRTRQSWSMIRHKHSASWKRQIYVGEKPPPLFPEKEGGISYHWDILSCPSHELPPLVVVEFSPEARTWRTLKPQSQQQRLQQRRLDFPSICAVSFLWWS